MIKEATYYGGCEEHVITGNTNIYFSGGRMHMLRGASLNYVITLDEPRRFHHPGGPLWYIINKCTSAQTLKDHTGATVGSLGTNRVYKVYLLDKDTPTWYMIGHVVRNSF